MNFQIIIAILLIADLSYAGCNDWFNEQKLKLNSDTCLSKCLVADVDMSTFSCRTKCESLCHPIVQKKNVVKKNKAKVINDNSSSLYPGLNEAEKKLVALHFEVAVNVGIQKFKAEHIADKLFSYGSIDGENDAARHFMWSALMAREIGTELATQFLDAHEKNPNQKPEQRAMDLANNREGLLAFERLKSKTKVTDEDIIQEFQNRFDGKNLSILKPQKKDML